MKNYQDILKSTLKEKTSKEIFDYAISLISRIEDPLERISTFNSYMEKIYIKSAKGDVQQNLQDVLAKQITSAPLSDFLKTFGENWKQIKSHFSTENYHLLLDAIAYSESTLKVSALNDKNFSIPQDIAINFIKSLEFDYQKQKFLTPEQIERFSFSRNQISDIISHFIHDNQKIKFLDDKYSELGIGSKEVTDVVKSLKFDSNKLKFLNKHTFDYFGLTNINATNIAKSLNKDTNKMKLLAPSHVKKLELTNLQVCSIIRTLSADEQKLSFLNANTLNSLFNIDSDKDMRGIIGEIATSLEEDESKLSILTPEKVAELGLRNFNIAYLASTLTDDENKIQVIKQANQLKLNTKNISRIVSSFSNEQLKLEFLENPEYKFSPSEQAKIVSTLKNPKNLEKYLDNPNIARYKNSIILGMDSDNKTLSPSRFDYLCKLADINARNLHNLSMPVLPPKMTIGVELELVGKNKKGNSNATVLRNFRNLIAGFTAKVDTSLNGYENASGVEIISPILMNHNLENLNLVSKLVQKNQLDVNDTCGAHVHIGADYLDSIESWKNLYEIWGNNEDLMYQITNKPGSTPRQGMSEYAKPLSPKMADAISKGTINLKSEKDLDKFIKDVQYLQWGPNKDQEQHPGEDLQKYFGLNFKNTNSVNKNTIEFRLPNGTTDPQTLMHNIRLFSRIVDISKQLGDTEIALKSGHKLTPQQKKLLLARTALTESKSNNPDERLSNLMNLLFDDEEIQNIYIDRYKQFPKETLSQFKFGHFEYRKWYNEGKDNMMDFLNTYTTERTPAHEEK